MLKVNIKKNLPSFSLNINFQQKKGILGLLGASGSGKSLTLKSIAGLITPDEGSIILNNEILYDSSKRINLKPQKRNAGYLFQNYALFPNMTVSENIEAGLFKLSNTEKKEIVNYYIEKLNLKGLENHYPSELSGGQQQRAALARAMAPNPKILLLDEPFSALDVHLKSQLEKDLIPVLKEYEGLIIMVSHDIQEAYRICDEIIVYEKGFSLPKRNKEDLFKHPLNLTEAKITGCQNILKVKKINDKDIFLEDLDITINFENELEENINYVAIRSHDITLSTDTTSSKLRIDNIIENPFSYRIFASYNSLKTIEIEVNKNNFNYKINDIIYIKFNKENIALF